MNIPSSASPEPIPRLSFGCMSLDVTDSASIPLLQSAYDEGITHFDTADLYDKGANEILLGKAVHSFRQHITISTKAGNQWKPDGSGWTWNPTPSYLIKAIEDSLIRLQTDYIDLLQLHGGTIDDPVEDVITTFEQLKKQGKIRAYGISSIRPNVIRKWVGFSNMSSVMMQYSILDRRPEEELLSLLEENGIGVLARGVLAKGLLIDKQPTSYLDHSESAIVHLQSAMKDLGNAPELALGFVLQQPAVQSVVAGIRTRQHLNNLLYAYRSIKPDVDYQALFKDVPAFTYNKHR
ncbi:MAG: aldo/keto reductase [Bacteroidota bacterium]